MLQQVQVAVVFGKNSFFRFLLCGFIIQAGIFLDSKGMMSIQNMVYPGS